LKIKNKLTLVTVLVFLIVAVIMGFIYISSYRVNLAGKAYDSASAKSRESANIIAQMFEVRLNAVRQLVDFLSENIEEDTLNQKITALQYSLRMSGFDYYALKWYDDWYIITKSAFALRKPVRDFSRYSGSVLYDGLYEDSQTRLLFIQPVNNGIGGKIGCIVAALPTSFFWDEIMSTESLSVSDDLMITKIEGDILYSNDYQGGTLSGNENGSVYIETEHGIVKRIGFSTPVSHTNLNVTVLVDEKTIADEMSRTGLIFSGVVGLALAVIGAFVYLAASRMTKSIADLARLVENMDPESGSIPEGYTRRKDEAGILANSFSRLLSRLRASLDETEYNASHDSLTLLKNRYSLEKEVAAMIAEKRPFAFALLDVDDFKVINDTWGHDEGDRFLKDIASVLRTFYDTELVAYRWGGDEFAIVVFGGQTACYETMMKRIMERMDSHFSQMGGSRVTVSIGVCTYPENAGTYKDLLIHADKALAWAKMSGKVNFCFYNG